MNIKPIGMNHLIIPDEKEETRGGIIIPDIAKERPMLGLVVASGNGSTDKDGKHLECRDLAGQRVIFSKYAGKDCKINDKDHLLIDEKDILAVVE